VVLSRKLFIWNANEFCKIFKEKKTALEFSEEWQAWLHSNGGAVDNREVPPPAKRACTKEVKNLEENSKWMDDIDCEIEKHKVGMS
jgi:hypothetical protein